MDASTPTLSENSSDFALALYAQAARTRENIFFSPFSVSMALDMARAGAQGETAAQISTVLRVDVPSGRPCAAFAAILRRLDAGNRRNYTVHVANALWAQTGPPLLRGFSEVLKRHYASAMKVIDFRRDTEAARKTINTWAEEETRHAIRDLVPPGGVTTETRLILANALYFKGVWSSPFETSKTVDQPFYCAEGTTVMAPLMHRRGGARHMRTEGFQAIEFDYKGDDVSFIALLPDARDGLPELELKLTGRLLDDCAARMAFCEVDIFLPRFRVEWSAGLQDHLRAVGMPLAFSQQEADFSGVNGYKRPDARAFFIGDVAHKARVDVNEQGTEAAAATVTIKLGLDLEPAKLPTIPTFRADHPFLFALRDRQTGVILFLGCIADPTR